MVTLYDINADCCWGDSCEADFWGIFDTDQEWDEYCKTCKKRKNCSHWKK